MANKLSDLRKALLAGGYWPLPGIDKGCKLRGWSGKFLADEAAKPGGLPVAIESWDDRMPNRLTTNVLVRDGLVVIDGDVDDPELMAELGAIIKDVAPGVYMRAPLRYGSGTHKAAWFCRLAEDAEPFVRVGTHKYARPDDLAAWRSDGTKKPAYHHVEVFGGALSKGKAVRQFGVYGPHSKGVEYAWADGPTLSDTPLSELPEIGMRQIAEITRRFEEAAAVTGWAVLPGSNSDEGGEVLFDIDREKTRFETAEHEWVSYDEICNQVATGEDVRLWATFIPGEEKLTESPDRCQAMMSDKYKCVMIYDHKLRNTHLPSDLKPRGVSDKAGALLKLEDNGPAPAETPAPTEVSESFGAGKLVTQDAVGLWFAELYSDRLRFCHHTGAWFEWNGDRWRKEDTHLAFHFCRVLARKASRNCVTDEQIRAVRKVSFCGGVERFARDDRRVAVTSEFWDRDAFSMGVPGGTLNLRTGLVRASEPGEGVSKQAAVAPLLGAPTPVWDRFLMETFDGDLELIRYIQCWFGYCLTGDTREHALWFGFGNGGNGKGVLINTISWIMGDYARTAPMETFTAKKFDSHPTELAMLRGARLVTASETEEGRAWAESRIKQITGGDPVTARFMHKDFFTYQPAFKLALIGNHKPVLRNVDAAIRRRFRLVPFMNDVPEGRQDRQLQEKLRAEWPGILQWLVEGCLDWQMNGLTLPDAVKRATDSYFVDQDVMGQWLADCCQRHPKAETPTAELFASWVRFAQDAGELITTRRAFTNELSRRGFEVSRTETARTMKGIRLKKPGASKLYPVAGTDFEPQS